MHVALSIRFLSSMKVKVSHLFQLLTVYNYCLWIKCFSAWLLIIWKIENVKMGNNHPIEHTIPERPEISSRILLFLHRTWTVIVTEKWLKTRENRQFDSSSDYSSQCSQYSFCSCSQCQKDDGFSSGCFRWVETQLSFKFFSDFAQKLN